MFIIPNKYTFYQCCHFGLDNIMLNRNLKSLSCYGNKIKEINITDNLKYIECDIFVKLYNINNKELTIIFGRDLVSPF